MMSLLKTISIWNNFTVKTESRRKTDLLEPKCQRGVWVLTRLSPSSKFTLSNTQHWTPAKYSLLRDHHTRKVASPGVGSQDMWVEKNLDLSVSHWNTVLSVLIFDDTIRCSRLKPNDQKNLMRLTEHLGKLSCGSHGNTAGDAAATTPASQMPASVVTKNCDTSLKEPSSSLNIFCC